MNDRAPSEVELQSSGSDGPRDRIICVVARDVLSLEHREAEIDRFFLVAWRARWLILAMIVLFAFAATAYALVATEWYVAETVVTPVSNRSMNGLASRLGALGALTGLAGIDLNDEKDTAEAIGVLKSKDFARQFIEDNQLLHVLLWTQWDTRANRWKVSNPRKQPDIRDAIRYFDRSVLIVREDRKTGLVTLGIRWKDPVIAASWANMILERLNAQMRARALTEGEKNVAYLEKEMASATQVALQAAIAQLIETELQKVMIARSTPEFAFRVVDHAAAPKQHSWPQRMLIVSIGILAGGLIGLMAAFLRDFLTRRRSVVREPGKT